VVEAHRFDGTATSAAFIINWAGGMVTGPFDEDRVPYLLVKTVDAVGRVDDGDWVIQGVAHEYYPCKNDVFEFTYDRVEGPDG